MDDRPLCGPLVVAVDLDRRSTTLACAMDAARRLDVELVVVHVEEAVSPAYSVIDGTMVMLPLDPDLPQGLTAEATRAVREWVEQQLGPSGLRWRWVERCGEPDRCLAELAEEVDASCIVLGAPHHGLLHALTRLVDGSVAAKLTRHQSRPVLVVP